MNAIAARYGNVLLAMVLLAALVWPLAGPAASPGAAAPLSVDLPTGGPFETAEECLQRKVVNEGETDIEESKAECAAAAVPPDVQAQIDAAVASNAGKLVADYIPNFRACLVGKVAPTYLGLGSPALPAGAAADCMGLMERNYWTKAPDNPVPGQIDAAVARNAGKLVADFIPNFRGCLEGAVKDNALPAGAEAACLAEAERNYWTKGPGVQIDAIVGRNAGNLVDGGAEKLRECLEGRVTEAGLPADAEAACMGVMEANFWTKRPDSATTQQNSCDGLRDVPVLGMLSALWADDCGDEDED